MEKIYQLKKKKEKEKKTYSNSAGQRCDMAVQDQNIQVHWYRFEKECQ